MTTQTTRPATAVCSACKHWSHEANADQENHSHYLSCMAHNTELDPILASLAKPLGRLSDTLLDLRQWARSPSCAGSCVKAYFDLVGEAPDAEEAARPLAALRVWLEARLNIRVIDANRADCLETLPLTLAGETDLEQFCLTAMQRLREDRCHGVPHLRLEFGFSQNFNIAA